MLAANAAFYAAIEAADLDAMSDLWEHSERVVCTHPGWATIRGWGGVSASWFSIFQGPQRLQFVLTNSSVAVSGGTAWVTIDENLLASGVGAGAGGTVAALNLFVRQMDGSWRMVAHHGSPVAASLRS
ncbi:MAG TPA: nuclear transport factor 2 family protein [Acidimicrobiales bacterium]|nr:nuclear transport factor 2 family protein [Acidimicrobiales bacterium]